MEPIIKGGHKTKRFTSQSSAEDFSKSTNGELVDCRGNSQRKSNFKVKYSRDGARNHMHDREWNGINNGFKPSNRKHKSKSNNSSGENHAIDDCCNSEWNYNEGVRYLVDYYLPEFRALWIFKYYAYWYLGITSDDHSLYLNEVLRNKSEFKIWYKSNKSYVGILSHGQKYGDFSKIPQFTKTNISS